MKQAYPTLYARDSKGKIVQWNIEVQNNNNQIDIKISYGEYGGGQAIRWQRDIKGKNIGKSNETNPWEQAISDCNSKIANKKKKGYMTLEEARANRVVDTEIVVKRFKVLTDDNRDTLLVELDKLLPEYRTDADGDIKPMKCQQYYRSKKPWIDPNGKEWTDRKYYYILNPRVKKEKGAIITKFPCIGQFKVNGVRCTIQLKDNKVLIKSKDGLEYNIPQVKDFLNINNDIFNYNNTSLILDGELYIHGELLQDIGSAVDKPNLNTPRIVFVLFDLAIPNISNIDRWDIIKNHIKPKLDIHLSCPIELVKTTTINSDNQAQDFTDFAISKGYEGSIFRQLEGMYQFGKRPTIITKLKRCISNEFKIIDIIPQEVDNTKGNFVCVNKEGLTFNVNPNGTDEYKRMLLTNKALFIGKNLTVDFYEWTKDKKPLHVISNTVRDYE